MRPWRRHFLALALAVLACALPAAAGGEQPRKKAALIPQWEPQAQFAGYYVAQEKGFYARRGVDMEILRGGPSRPPSALLADGRATFGTMFLATALLERSRGLRLVNLAQMLRGSTLLIVARAGKGVSSPKDLAGRRVSLWGREFSLQPEAFFRKHGVDVLRLPQGHSVDLFLRGGVDALCAMYYNEYHTLLNSGLDPEDLVVFPMRDNGFDYPEDGLYAMEDTCLKDALLCRDVAEASVEGWLYAFEHPAEALDIVMARVDEVRLPTNRMHQKWMLERLREAMLPQGGAGPGGLHRAEFEKVARALDGAGLLDAPVSYEEFRAPAP